MDGALNNRTGLRYRIHCNRLNFWSKDRTIHRILFVLAYGIGDRNS
jgi:hypothetical protein